MARLTDLTKMTTWSGGRLGFLGLAWSPKKRAATNLVELERVEEVVELAVLGALLEADEVLLKSVERELLLVVDVDFERLWIERCQNIPSEN